MMGTLSDLKRGFLVSTIFSNRRQSTGAKFLLISLIIIGLDQLTKWLCVTYIEQGSFGIEVLPFFNLVHVYNYGAAFSILADWGGVQRYLLAGLALIITLALTIALLRTKAEHKWTCLAYALFIGGAIGNLIDRVILGYVIDFLLFYWRDDSGVIVWAYPAFNVADIAVCCGAALLVITALFGGKSKKSK